MSLIENLNWRYATKRMNGEVVPKDKLTVILEAIRLTATSYGLQTHKVFAVTNAEIKTQLKAAAYGQAQLVESDVVLVFAVQQTITEADVDAYFDNIKVTRNMDITPLEGYKQMMKGTVTGMNAEQQNAWASKQAYIALGFAMAAAADQKVDSCPMEGFDRTKFDEILGLNAKGYTSTVLLPLGFRSTEDFMANLPKVRKTIDELVEYIS